MEGSEGIIPTFVAKEHELTKTQMVGNWLHEKAKAAKSALVVTAVSVGVAILGGLTQPSTSPPPILGGGNS